MPSRVGAYLRSLEIRLLLPLAATIAAVLAVHALLSLRSTEEHFLGFVRGGIERSSDLIKRATHDGMLLNRLDEVQATIERLAESPEVAAIRVYDKDGFVVLSAQREETGRRITLDSPTCGSCHAEQEIRDKAVLERSSLARVSEDPEVLRHLTVIENEPACTTAPCHYHPPDRRVLGVLDVEVSMAPLAAAVGAAKKQLLWTTLALIGISGAVAAGFVRRVVHRPVLHLYRGTRRIAAGDLDTRIDVRGEHELARLAEAFNRMAADLRTARRELTEWSQTLEEKVAEKTDALRRAQAQVIHMEKMASLGKLSATVAHELNNPLSGMLTYNRLVKRELAEQAALDADVREELDRYLSLMDRECSRCGTIVHNLLTFARQTGAEMAEVDVNEIVGRSLMLVRHHLEISNVHLVTERPEGDGTIVADAGQVQQALVALLVNAVEAMGPVRDREKVLTVRLEADEETVEIVVADTGVGIPPDVLSRIFEPFFSTKGGESGVGLGLAVVYGIVNRHGGSIDVDSEPGRGTTFRLRLPRRAAEDQEEAPTDVAQHAGAR